MIKYGHKCGHLECCLADCLKYTEEKHPVSYTSLTLQRVQNQTQEAAY